MAQNIAKIDLLGSVKTKNWINVCDDRQITIILSLGTFQITFEIAILLVFFKVHALPSNELIFTGRARRMNVPF